MDKELSSLTVAQLRQLAGHLGVDLSGASRKAEVVDRIRAVSTTVLGTRTVAELKTALDLLDASKSGMRAELIDRVLSAVGAPQETAPADAADPSPVPARRFPWKRLVRAVAAIAAVALVAWGIFAFGRYAFQAYQAQLARIPAAAADESVEVLSSIVRAKEALAPIVEAEENPLEVEIVTDLASTEVFTYTPGGESFGQWATDVITPDGATQPCGRIWQATNLENLPWTAIFCDWQVSEVAPKLQWPHATQLTVSGDGIVEFELWRDIDSSTNITPDPYDVANVKSGPLGLGWFVQGFNGTVCVDGDCQELVGGGVYQIGFPSDLQGHYDIRIVVDSGQVNFWQGERLTNVDNWPIPAD